MAKDTLYIMNEADIPDFLRDYIVIYGNMIHFVGSNSKNDVPLGTLICFQKSETGYSFKKLKE